MVQACHAAVGGHLDLVGFLLLGALGSLGHCGAMCSPVVLFVSRRYCAAGCPRRATLVAQSWYHAGRILVYAMLGAAAGALGSAIELTGRVVGLQRSAAVVAGVVLVLFGVSTFVRLLPSGRDSGGIVSALVRAAGSRVPGHPFATGLVLGFLPCGFLYSAVVAAAALGGTIHGAAALACFGVGTMPALLGVSALDEVFARHRVVIDRFSYVVILATGVWFVWLGLAR